MNELVLSLVCSGQDGSAAGTVLSTATVTGVLKGILVEREAGGEYTAMPDTNEVLITAEGPPDLTLLDLKGKTDAIKLYCPKTPACHVGGEPILYEGAAAVGEDFPLAGNKIKVEVNNANNGDEMTIRVRYE